MNETTSFQKILKAALVAAQAYLYTTQPTPGDPYASGSTTKIEISGKQTDS
jgi:hypothetical protein